MGYNCASTIDAHPRLGVSDRFQTEDTITRHFRTLIWRAAGPKTFIGLIELALHGCWTKITWCLGHPLHPLLWVPDLATVVRRTKRRREPLLELIGLERLDRRAAGSK